MPSQITLPDCLLGFYKELFPTLAWPRVHFYLGLPPPYSLGPQDAMTLPDGHSEIRIYVRPDKYQPCTQGCVTTLAHELVHALQIQQSIFEGTGAGLLSFWTISYLSCWSRQWYLRPGDDTNEESNPFEIEAFDYQRQLDQALSLSGGLPCICERGQPKPNKAFVGAAGLEKFRNVIKREATTRTPCRGEWGRLLVFWWLPRQPGDGAMWNVLGWAIFNAMLGFFILGGPIGAIVGFFGGALIGAIDELTGVPSYLTSILAAAFAALLNVTIQIVTAITDFLFGPGNRPLKIAFSVDNGVSFGEPSILGMTSEPPAIAFNNKPLDLTMYVAWKALDPGINVFTVNLTLGLIPRLTLVGNAQSDTGPSLAWGNDIVHLFYQAEDNKLFIRPSHDGIDFLPRVQFGGKGPDDATPGITFGNGTTFATWIRKRNNRIGLKSSANHGASWFYETTFYFGSHDEGTAAVAFISPLVFIARATKGDRKVKVAVVGTLPSGEMWVAQDYDLGVRCKDDSGPAIAAGNGLIFVSWIGRAEQKVHVRVFKLGPGGVMTQVSDTVLNERSVRNAGPALGYAEHPGVTGAVAGLGILALAWVRKN